MSVSAFMALSELGSRASTWVEESIAVFWIRTRGMNCPYIEGFPVLMRLSLKTWRLVYHELLMSVVRPVSSITLMVFLSIEVDTTSSPFEFYTAGTLFITLVSLMLRP